MVGLLLGLTDSIFPIRSLSGLLYTWLIGGNDPRKILTASPLIDYASKAWRKLQIS